MSRDPVNVERPRDVRAPDRETPFRRLADWIFGYDYFISYAHDDGRNYPTRLKQRLERTGFKTFLDTDVYVPGDDLRGATRRRVRMSRKLVVVARPGALKSKWVQREIEIHVAAGRTPILISINNTVEIAQSYPERAVSIPEEWLYVQETLADPDGEPSDRTLDALHRGFDATRQETKRSRVIASAAAGLAILTVSSLVASWMAVQQRNLAESRLRVALSRQYAAESLQRVDRDVPFSLIRSAEALDEQDTLEARNSLLTAIQASRQIVGFLWHGQDIKSVALSGDGSRVATASADGTVLIWDAVSRQREGAPLHHPGEVSEVALSADGGTLASVAVAEREEQIVDGESVSWPSKWAVLVWDLSNRESYPLPVRDDAPGRVAFGPDGDMLATWWNDEVILWDAATHTRIGAPVRPEGEIAAVALVRSQTNTVATKASDTALRIVRRGQAPGGVDAPPGHDDEIIRWDEVEWRALPSLDVVRTAGVGTSRGTAATDGQISAFDPDERFVFLSGNYSSPPRFSPGIVYELGFVAVWDLSQGRLSSPPTLHADGSDNCWPPVLGTYPCWDPPWLNFDGWVHSLAVAPDGEKVAIVSRPPFGAPSLTVWKLDSGVVESMDISGLPPVSAARFFPDGDRLALTGETAVTIWSLSPIERPGRSLSGLASFSQSGRAEPSHTPTPHIWSVEFSPDGKMLASAGNEGAVALWDVAAGREVGRLLHDGPVTSVAFSPDGSVLATASGGQETGSALALQSSTLGAVTLWNVLAREPLEPVFSTSQPVAAVAFGSSPDVLAMSSGDRTLRYDVGALTSPASGFVSLWLLDDDPSANIPLPNDGAGAWRLAFSPDGKALAAVDAYHRVRLWELGAEPYGEPVVSLEGAWDVAFSRDGTLLAATGFGEVRLRRLPDGESFVLPLPEQTEAVSLGFGENGILLAGTASGVVHLFDVERRAVIGGPLRVGGVVWDMAVSPDGRTFATGSSAGEVMLWELGSWSATACEIVKGASNPTEDQQPCSPRPWPPGLGARFVR